MKNDRIAGIITAVAVLCGFIAALNTSSGLPIWQWPIDAYKGLAFTIAWLSNVPDGLAYILAIIVFVVIAAISYMLGSWVYRKVSNMD